MAALQNLGALACAALSATVGASALGIRVASLAGLAISAYALYVEARLAADDDYAPPCDIKKGRLKGASCSSVFTSPHGKILSKWKLVRRGSALDFSNAALGAAFYVMTALHDALLPAAPPLLLLAACAASLLFSAYLAYILRYVLKEFCVVCYSMYAVNVALAVLAAARVAAGGSAGVCGGGMGGSGGEL